MTRFSPGFIFPSGVNALDTTYHGQWVNTGDSGNVDPTPIYSFNQATHGISTSDDKVYIEVVIGNSLTVTRVTVNGSDADLVVRSATNGRDTSIWSIAHGGGNLGTIAIIKSGVGTASRCGIGVITANGGSAASLTATNTGNTDTADPLTYSSDIPAGGFAMLAFATSSNPGATTWTGLTQDHITAIEGSNNHALGHLEYAAAVTGQTLEANTTSGLGTCTSVFAVFGP